MYNIMYKHMYTYMYTGMVRTIKDKDMVISDPLAESTVAHSDCLASDPSATANMS